MENDAPNKTWTCQICGQVVEQQANGQPLHPVQTYENCRLKNFSVGNECIAYRDPPGARDLAEGFLK